MKIIFIFNLLVFLFLGLFLGVDKTLAHGGGWCYHPTDTWVSCGTPNSCSGCDLVNDDTYCYINADGSHTGCYTRYAEIHGANSPICCAPPPPVCPACNSSQHCVSDGNYTVGPCSDGSYKNCTPSNTGACDGSTTCTGSTATGTCGTTCAGTMSGSCIPAETDHCTGTYADSCGNSTCNGMIASSSSNWSSWGSCTVSGGSCGTGTQTRTCEGAVSCGGSNNCTGSSSQSCTISCPAGQSCLSGSCCTPTSSNWSSWGSCTVSSGSCGAGTQTRTCDGTASCGGSNNCTGSSSQSCTISCPAGQSCLSGSCCTPTNGGWSAFGACSSCSQSRTCTSPAPSCGGAACVGSSTQACGDVNGGWSAFGACSSCSQSRTCTSPAPSCGGAACVGSATQACGYSNGTSASCGSSDGGIFSSAPSSNLCSSGSSSGISYSALTRSYSWTCYGTSGSCGGSSGSDSSCAATKNTEPTFSSLTLVNLVGVTMPAENVVIAGVNTSINQICQTGFTDRTVKFVVQGEDLDISSDITKIQLRLGTNIYDPNAGSFSNGQAEFTVVFPENSSKITYNIEVLIDDNYLPAATWVDTGRDLKIWNCQVPVSGTLYDNSVGEMFSVVGDSKINFNALSYDVISPSASYAMTTSNNPATYTSGANNLVWGTIGILPTFNNDQLVGGKNDLAVTDMWMRTIDLGTGATNSPIITFQFDVDNNLVSPYSDSPALRIDYSAVVDQASWFQVIAGGVVAKNIVTDNIPVTCDSDPACHAAITIGSNDSIDQNNGLVSAPTISGCGSDNKCEYGIPNNLSLTANVLKENYGYKYFYEGYHAKYGLGKTYSTDTSMSQIKSDIGGTGVVFVNGNLTINDNNSLSTNEFLMVVVSGVVMVNSDVNNMAGYFVSDGSIIANNTSNNNLTVDGLLYSSKSNVTLSRSYTEKSDNNNKPAVIINYRPDLLFSMPSRLSKILSGWAEGN